MTNIYITVKMIGWFNNLVTKVACGIFLDTVLITDVPNETVNFIGTLVIKTVSRILLHAINNYNNNI